MACKAFFAPHRDSLVLWEHLQNHASHHNRPYNIEPPAFVRLEYVCEHSRCENDAAEYQLAHVFLEHINFYYLFHLLSPLSNFSGTPPELQKRHLSVDMQGLLPL